MLHQIEVIQRRTRYRLREAEIENRYADVLPSVLAPAADNLESWRSWYGIDLSPMARVKQDLRDEL